MSILACFASYKGRTRPCYGATIYGVLCSASDIKMEYILNSELYLASTIFNIIWFWHCGGLCEHLRDVSESQLCL